ncbi:peptidyl-prolyl cis-trans isomerase-like 2 [Lingula anatina]|uniref:RING-type E3 ubiquitin-protein ligase PPIL2 n=1 Tax=Lingula anatina TaxID=7574 RepID=A0A1S3JNK6_LINAN|nr:peptidyl-prolyl cis-trans isomerase-like 2 [Lingula anatina]|eukprot:XP_013411955.2 peptidyl-prolyl cis-trans isomerase-like 2 [Lingula anatina]
MGKKQHQKDKLYLTCTEWTHLYGGHKGGKEGEKAKFRRLPFHCCSLSLQPFEHPLCTKEGVIFDLMNIVPFLKKYKVSPVTGKPMSAKELIKLNFYKNSEDKYHCPVTFKVFNENSHIVAIKPTGNVFSYDAVERLNLKTGHLKDLINDEPFTRADIITIQDPTNLDKFNLANFYHLKNNVKVEDEDEVLARKDPKFHLKSINAETRDVLNTLDKEYKAPEKTVVEKKVADKFNAASYSTGRVAASFTSTAMDPETRHEAALIDEDIIKYERVKKKGYVRLVTSKGVLNLELHCEMVPKTCENFMKHCASGYYKGTTFHRSIRNFMIQGGDPTGTGKGGESVWGGAFKDEFKPNLTHSGRGVLSMANSGPNTNKSQFFITFRSCRHLDQKHAVFGRVVGGLDTLDAMEKVDTDKNDRPVEEIKLISCTVFVNPYQEAEEQLAKEREMELAREKEEQAKLKQRFQPKKKEDGPKVYREGVGKYISTEKRDMDETDNLEPVRKKSKGKTGFGDFSSW